MAAIAELFSGFLLVFAAVLAAHPRSKGYLLSYFERSYFMAKGTHYRASRWLIEHQLVPVFLLLVGLAFVVYGVQDL